MAFYPFGPSASSYLQSSRNLTDVGSVNTARDTLGVDNFWLAPATATAETFPRTDASAYSAALTSGVPYGSAIALPAGLPINNLGTMIGNTAFATVTNGWYALADLNGTVQAVTPNQTTAFQTSFANVKVPTTATYTTTYSGYYVFYFCAVAVTMGVLINAPTALSTPLGTLPALCGTSGTGATNPPALLASLPLAYASGNPRFYAYTA